MPRLSCLNQRFGHLGSFFEKLRVSSNNSWGPTYIKMVYARSVLACAIPLRLLPRCLHAAKCGSEVRLQHRTIT